MEAKGYCRPRVKLGSNEAELIKVGSKFSADRRFSLFGTGVSYGVYELGTQQCA